MIRSNFPNETIFTLFAKRLFGTFTFVYNLFFKDSTWTTTVYDNSSGRENILFKSTVVTRKALLGGVIREIRGIK